MMIVINTKGVCQQNIHTLSSTQFNSAATEASWMKYFESMKFGYLYFFTNTLKKQDGGFFKMADMKKDYIVCMLISSTGRLSPLMS